MIGGEGAHGRVGVRIDGRGWALEPATADNVTIAIRLGGLDMPGAEAIADLFTVTAWRADQMAEPHALAAAHLAFEHQVAAAQAKAGLS